MKFKPVYIHERKRDGGSKSEKGSVGVRVQEDGREREEEKCGSKSAGGWERERKGEGRSQGDPRWERWGSKHGPGEGRRGARQSKPGIQRDWE